MVQAPFPVASDMVSGLSSPYTYWLRLGGPRGSPNRTDRDRSRQEGPEQGHRDQHDHEDRFDDRSRTVESEMSGVLLREVASSSTRTKRLHRDAAEQVPGRQAELPLDRRGDRDRDLR